MATTRAVLFAGTSETFCWRPVNPVTPPVKCYEDQEGCWGLKTFTSMAREYKINASDYLLELGHSQYEIVKGEPDIRGWTVTDGQGKTIGEVEDLLFDPQARKVRYLIVDLEDNVLDLEPRDVAVPIGLAELHEEDDEVMLPNVSPTQLQMLPVYDRDTFNPEVENAVHHIFTQSAPAGAAAGAGEMATSSPEHTTRDYSHEHFDERNLYRHRKARTVIGLFADVSQARRAVDELLSNGCSRSNMELAVRQSVDPAQGYAPDRFEHFFDSLFLSPEEAGRYRERELNSNAVVAVHTYSQEQARRAADILDRYNPIDLGDAAGRHYAAGTAPVAGAAGAAGPAGEAMPPGKPQAATGTRLRSRIMEHPVEENLRLRRERLRIERVPVNRPATEADLASFQEGTIELTEHAEVPIVSKEARVVEEIHIEKVMDEHEETVRETKRKTDVQLDPSRKDEPGQIPEK